MNLYKEKMLKHSSLKGKRRANHKYLYIDENGRYIYPDDVKKSGGHSSGGTSFSPKKLKGNFLDSFPETVRKEENNNAINLAERSKMRRKQAIANRDSLGLYKSGSDLERAWQLDNLSKGKKANTDTYIRKQKLDKSIQKEHRKMIDEKRTNDEKISKASKQQEQERSGRRDQINKEVESNRKSKVAKDWNNRWKAEKSKTNSAEQQRKSAHVGYELDKKMYPDGGSTEELGRQKKKTKARKSAKNVTKDTNVVRISSETRESGRDRHNQHKQINSAHQEATRFRPEGGHLYNGDWVLESRTHNNSSDSIERQKRKTALRKRRKK